MKIGILGGSFDPIHNGHIHMAVSAYSFFHLDEVWLMPAGHSPNKNEADMTSALHRFQMCEIAAASDERLMASRFEIDCPERSYTYRTLERLTEAYPMHQFDFIMGGDSLDYFEKWIKPERICELATILVVPRDEFDMDALTEKANRIHQLFPSEIHIVPCSRYPVSSTTIREKLAHGCAGADDFPPGVLDYIRQNRLYTKYFRGDSTKL